MTPARDQAAAGLWEAKRFHNTHAPSSASGLCSQGLRSPLASLKLPDCWEGPPAPAPCPRSHAGTRRRAATPSGPRSWLPLCENTAPTGNEETGPKARGSEKGAGKTAPEPDTATAWGPPGRAPPRWTRTRGLYESGGAASTPPGAPQQAQAPTTSGGRGQMEQVCPLGQGPGLACSASTDTVPRGEAGQQEAH